MAKAPGKKQRKKKRMVEPASYFIGTEGTKTEVLYFQEIAKYLVKEYGDYAGRIEVPNMTVEGIGTSNFRLIQDVEEYLRTDPRLFENVWIVFDKDDIPLDYFDNSIQQAEAKGYKAAWSNDSFELWYLLHFELLQSGITREQYKEKLTAHLEKNGLEKYEKNNLAMFDILLVRKETAIRNGCRLEENFENEPPSKRNPCTTVHHLVKEIFAVEKEVQKIKAIEKYSSYD